VTGEGAGYALAITGEFAVEEVGGSHGDARGAKTALHRTLANEGVGEEPALSVRQSFEGHDLAAGDLGWIELARQRGFVVEQDRAAAAHALRRTAVLGGGDAARFTKHTQKVRTLLVRDGGWRPVELER
jgi:hypothetical protein